MYGSGKMLPRVMHESSTFIYEPLSVLIHHNPVRVIEDQWRWLTAPWVDYFAVHSVPIARGLGSVGQRHLDAVAGVPGRPR